MTDENDKRRARHLYHFEMLYAAVVEGFIEWQTAIVEAVICAWLSDATPPCLRAHERCTAKLASLLQLATSYREGREWRCECHHCNFMCGLRNYLTHHWTRDGRDFAISGARWRGISVWTDRNERGYAHTYAPCVTVALVGKALKKRSKFTTAARALGDGGPLVNLAPIVDGYMACRSANCASWRAQNPLPEPDGRRHDYPRTHLLELARELRRASAGRGLGAIGLVGGAWE